MKSQNNFIVSCRMYNIYIKAYGRLICYDVPCAVATTFDTRCSKIRWKKYFL